MNLNRISAMATIQDMKSFYGELKGLYDRTGIDINEDVGRRNILMSLPMEHNLANRLKSFNDKVENDGRTGKADIVVTNGELETELECKLTSPHRSGSISLQSDYETLLRKGELDYIYIVADRKFEKFVVVHFEKLTVSDFRDVSPGSRGKVQMRYSKAMKKASILVGDIESSIVVKRRKLFESIVSTRRKGGSRVMELQGRLESCSPKAVKKKQNILGMIERVIEKTESKALRLMREYEEVGTKKPRFSFKFEEA